MRVLWVGKARVFEWPDWTCWTGLKYTAFGESGTHSGAATGLLVCWAAVGVDPDNQWANPRANGISMGNPLATAGTRMLAILANELPALDQRFALETM